MDLLVSADSAHSRCPQPFAVSWPFTTSILLNWRRVLSHRMRCSEMLAVQGVHASQTLAAIPFRHLARPQLFQIRTPPRRSADFCASLSGIGGVGLASLNRFRLTPALAPQLQSVPKVSESAGALRVVTLSVAIETGAAVVVLTNVAWLGTLAPPALGG